MRMIDADNLIELIKEQKVRETGKYTEGLNKGLDIAKSIINDKTQAPTIEISTKEAEAGLHDEEWNNADKNEKIKPCPFCGSKAEIISFNYEYGTVTIGCTNEDCDITMGKGFFTDEEAIEHWNRRK